MAFARYSRLGLLRILYVRKIYISLPLKNLVGPVLVGGLVCIVTYKRTNEALSCVTGPKE